MMSKRMSSPPPIYSQVHQGEVWDLAAPGPAAVDAREIAKGLACISRYNGTADTRNERWTVLGHSMLVFDLLHNQSLSYGVCAYGLLHDAHEVYLGDMVTPVQRLIERRLPVFERVWRGLKRDHDRAIFLAFGLPELIPAEVFELVKWADAMALSIERRDLLPVVDDGYWGEMLEPDSNFNAKKYLNTSVAEYLNALHRVCPMIAVRSWHG